jgi:hypothetical protein
MNLKPKKLVNKRSKNKCIHRAGHGGRALRAAPAALSARLLLRLVLLLLVPGFI